MKCTRMWTSPSPEENRVGGDCGHSYRCLLSLILPLLAFHELSSANGRCLGSSLDSVTLLAVLLASAPLAFFLVRFTIYGLPTLTKRNVLTRTTTTDSRGFAGLDPGEVLTTEIPWSGGEHRRTSLIDGGSACARSAGRWPSAFVGSQMSIARSACPHMDTFTPLNTARVLPMSRRWELGHSLGQRRSVCVSVMGAPPTQTRYTRKCDALSHEPHKGNSARVTQAPAPARVGSGWLL
uniref:Uncharacterized protein TCIL3000_8_4640 n=1 Tax=Trypanosoma congolense (strain IL3000) TaxID=1068625 RepID=G0US79_TRYCI|nr:unnamed protein product [Trypanosoma congolense IL3000]